MGEQGAAEGAPSDLPPPPEFVEGWQIGNPDLIVKAEKPTICRRAERINTGICFPHAGERNAG